MNQDKRAIKFALDVEEGWHFLRAYLEGNIDACKALGFAYDRVDSEEPMPEFKMFSKKDVDELSTAIRAAKDLQEGAFSQAGLNVDVLQLRKVLKKIKALRVLNKMRVL